jgi:AraC-like DNA-binding protein
MEDNHIIQNALDLIDNRITERIAPQELANECGYSVFYFNRLFSSVIGITLAAYVTRRKLQHALFDLSCGEKLLTLRLNMVLKHMPVLPGLLKNVSGIPRLFTGFTPFAVGRREWNLTN